MAIARPNTDREKPTYMDPLGRVWNVDKLDALLAVPKVQAVVDAGLRHNLTSRGMFQPGHCYVWCRGRYEREAPAALLHLLVVRHRDRLVRP